MSRPTEPPPAADLRELLLSYLEYYRDDIAAVLTSLSPEELHRSRVPSGWTPAGLAQHLLHVERRWFQWGFLAQDIERPWGDHENDDSHDPRWTTSELPLDDVLDRWREAGERTREIVLAHGLEDRAAVGGRFTDAESAPDLAWIIAHVLQEYARHAGQLDIVAEQGRA